jgi:hypothetical protein
MERGYGHGRGGGGGNGNTTPSSPTYPLCFRLGPNTTVAGRFEILCRPSVDTWSPCSKPYDNHAWSRFGDTHFRDADNASMSTVVLPYWMPTSLLSILLEKSVATSCVQSYDCRIGHIHCPLPMSWDESNELVHTAALSLSWKAGSLETSTNRAARLEADDHANQ